VGDQFYSEEQQDQQQLPFTEGKYNMGFPCTPTQLIMRLHVSNFDNPKNILATYIFMTPMGRMHVDSFASALIN